MSIRHTLGLFFLAVQIPAAGANESPSPFQLEPVAISGQAMPGTGGGVLRRSLELGIPGALDLRGQVSFTAEIDGGTSEQGVFASEASGLRAIALEGDAPPAQVLADLGLASGVYTGFTFGMPGRSDRGETVFVAEIDSFSGSVILVERNRVLEVAAATSSRLGNGSGRQIEQIQQVGMSAAGSVFLIAEVTGLSGGPGTRSQASAVLVVNESGIHELVRAEGLAPPGTGGAALLAFDFVHRNDGGEMVIAGRVTNPAAPNRPRSAVFRHDGETLHLVALSGDSQELANGTTVEFNDVAVSFRGVDRDRSIHINERGVIVFSAQLAGDPQLQASFDTRNFLERKGRIYPLEVEGSPITLPGFPLPFVLNERPQLNDTRDLVFDNLREDDTQIFMRSGRYTALVVEGGMVAPGTQGALFSGSTRARSRDVNDHAEVLFESPFDDGAGIGLFLARPPACNDARDNDHDRRVDADGATFSRRDRGCMGNPFRAHERKAPGPPPR